MARLVMMFDSTTTVTCGTCGNVIPAPVFLPLEFVIQDGGPRIRVDYTAVYEHMRDNHPEVWSRSLEVEYERWKSENEQRRET